MSIILDALKKADAERHLGELPGLHTAPPVVGSAPVAARRRDRGPVIAIALLCLLMAVLALLRPWRTRESVAVDPAVPAASVKTAPATIADGDPARTVAASEVSAPPPQPVVPTPKPVSVPAPPPAVAVAAPARTNPAASNSAPTREPQKAVPKQSGTATATASAPEPVNAISLAQLSPAMRAELPALTIGGSMYSSNPADRMLLVDKRMLHEGDEIAPGLLLELIQHKSAILRYKGVVFRLPF